jgi:hypothetical protein
MRKILLTATLLTFLVMPVAANAQTTTSNYSGTTSTTAAVADRTITVPHGALSGTTTFEYCPSGSNPGFVDGADPDATLTLNGTSAGTDVVAPPNSGCISVTVSLTSQGTGLGGARFAAAGLRLAATPPQVSIDGRTYNAQFGANTLSVFGESSFGGNLTVNHTFTIGAAPAGTGGALPRTGAMILRWTLAALALVAVGALLVFADRRRKVAPLHSDRTR